MWVVVWVVMVEVVVGGHVCVCPPRFHLPTACVPVAAWLCGCGRGVCVGGVTWGCKQLIAVGGGTEAGRDAICRRGCSVVRIVFDLAGLV